MVHGAIPDGLCVCHQCDVKLCLNPDHFYLATHRQNILDAIARGLLNPFPDQIGEAHRLSKLTNENVLFIRSSPLSNSELSRMLNVCWMTIDAVRLRKTWKHI